MNGLGAICLETRAVLCNECGKCASACPIAVHDAAFSPRRLLNAAVQGRPEDLLEDGRLWQCLTCGHCEARCPMQVRTAAFAQRVRASARGAGRDGRCSHGGALRAMMLWMGTEPSSQNRLAWVPGDLEVAEQGEVAYFVGCLPYFDAFFEDIDARSLDIARSAIRILNHVGIVPALMADERCCGHDLLWEGDEAGFERLAQRNVAAIEATGARTVVTSCAECARTLKLDYAERGLRGVEVLHMSELVRQKLAEGELKPRGTHEVVTYQDPCRLGQHLGVTDAPREILSSIPGLEFRELSPSGAEGTCCGTSAWTNCDACSRSVQEGRLEAARRAGASTLVTACPKCAIHYKCTMAGGMDPDLPEIRIRDLEEVVADSL